MSTTDFSLLLSALVLGFVNGEDYSGGRPLAGKGGLAQNHRDLESPYKFLTAKVMAEGEGFYYRRYLQVAMKPALTR